VAYGPYLGSVSDLVAGKRTVVQGMGREAERAEQAIAAAVNGQRVAVISSGDAGVYGMAGIILERLPPDSAVTVEVVPGVTAATAAAACLGAPLMNDFVVVSLSDLLTPLPLIKRRLQAAVDGDFVIALYNPRSSTRHRPLQLALEILRKYRPPATPVGLVRQALREGQRVRLTTLAEVDENEVDMLSILIIGNSATIERGGWMLTPRGYRP